MLSFVMLNDIMQSVVAPFGESECIKAGAVSSQSVVIFTWLMLKPEPW